MLDHLKNSLIGQFEASLAMLKLRIDACPDAYWGTNVGEGTIRQDTYHVLFWLDYYLSNEVDYTLNEFTLAGGDERAPVISPGVDRAQTLRFVEHCHEHIVKAISAETEASLQGGSGFPSIFVRTKLTRLELHLYNLRHLQHHTAQVSLALRKLSNEHSLELSLPWVGKGWM